MNTTIVWNMEINRMYSIFVHGFKFYTGYLELQIFNDGVQKSSKYFIIRETVLMKVKF